MDIIDYARPTLLAERALRNLHNAMLEKRYEEAKQHVYEAAYQIQGAFLAICEEQKNVRETSTGA